MATRDQAIAAALRQARSPRNRRQRAYYVIAVRPPAATQALGVPACDYIVSTWVDDNHEMIGYASGKDGLWHPSGGRGQGAADRGEDDDARR